MGLRLLKLPGRGGTRPSQMPPGIVEFHLDGFVLAETPLGRGGTRPSQVPPGIVEFHLDGFVLAKPRMAEVASRLRENDDGLPKGARCRLPLPAAVINR